MQPLICLTSLQTRKWQRNFQQDSIKVLQKELRNGSVLFMDKVYCSFRKNVSLIMNRGSYWKMLYKNMYSAKR